MRRDRAVVDDKSVLRTGSWCSRVGRQFTLSSPLKRKPVGPPAEHRRGRTPRAALACSRPDAVPVHASHQLPGARGSQLGSGGPRCRGLALSRLTGRRPRSASGSAYQRPLSDPPPGTSATTATAAQSRVRSTALARPRLGPALVSAAAEDDRAGGGELLSDQLAQLIVT